MAGLFDPLNIREVCLRNRIAVSPMVQTSSIDGFANDWHLVHLGARAVGGAALVMTEATAVEERGRISIGDLGIWKDAHVEALSRVVRFIKAEGAVAGIQLGHGGRKASYALPFNKSGMQELKPLGDNEAAWPVLGASPIPFDQDSPLPQMMTAEQIDDVVKAYGDAAERAVRAGFEWVEVHAAHGYLPHCFYSPISNTRTDEYGGSFKNRVRFARKVAQSVRGRLPDDLVLAFRLSYTDWVDGGWTLDETVKLARLLKSDGVDLIDVSSGGSTAKTVALMRQLRHENVGRQHGSSDPVADIPIGPGYQLPGATEVRLKASMPVAAVGLITTARQANDIVQESKADLIMLGRAMLRDPYWPVRAAIELGETERLRIPVQYHLGWKDEGLFSYTPVSAATLEDRQP